MSPSSVFTAAGGPAQPVLLLTNSHELQALLTTVAELAIDGYVKRQQVQQRLTSTEAAQHLGCSLSHLQTLHKEGLPYEKGRPNFYKLSDLDAHRTKRRLVLSQ